MKKGAPNVSVIGVGRTGSGFAPLAYADSAHGLYDAERAGHEQLRLRNGHGARDVSPSPAQEAAASAGKEPQAAYQQVVTDLVARAHNAIVLGRAQDGITMIAHDSADPVRGPLLTFHQQLPQQRIVSLCPFPEDGTPADHASAGCMMRPLASGSACITAIGHYGPRSPFASRNSPQRQERFVVATHDAICNAPRSHPANPSAGDLYERLGALGPCFQFGFCSLPLAIIRPKRFWASLKRVGGGPYPPAYGSLDNVLKVAAGATRLAYQPDAFTTADPFDPSRTHYVLYLLPFSGGGPVFRQFAERQSVWLASQYPAAEGVFVSGNGVPPLDGEGERFLQVSVLAPLAGPES